jgi:hypothetical protein
VRPHDELDAPESIDILQMSLSMPMHAPEAIVKAMQQFPLHGYMQLYGCQALHNLAHNEEGEKKVVEDVWRS